MMNTSFSERKSGKFVLPGDRLGVIEEFIPDEGTYVDNGIIHVKTVGHSLIDLLNKRVSVYPLIHGANVPKVGSVVLGQVSNVQTESLSARLFEVDNRRISGFFTGLLHISDVRVRYVESMFSVFKPADTIRAEVISKKNHVFHLSTKTKNLGVIYSFCSRCGQALEIKQRSLSCPKCGNKEQRKIALDFGKEL